MQNGRRYNVNGFPRVCYVPNSPKGQKVRHSELLKPNNLGLMPTLLQDRWKVPSTMMTIFLGSTYWQYTRRTCLQCMPRMLLNDLWTDRWHVHTLLLVGVVHAFGMVSYVQQSVKRMAKRSRKWARFRTPYQMLGYGCFSRQPFFASLAAALSYSWISPW